MSVENNVLPHSCLRLADDLVADRQQGILHATRSLHISNILHTKNRGIEGKQERNEARKKGGNEENIGRERKRFCTDRTDIFQFAERAFQGVEVIG